MAWTLRVLVCENDDPAPHAQIFRTRSIPNDASSEVLDDSHLPDILQRYVDEGVLQKDMPAMLKKKYNIKVSLRAVQKIMKTANVQSVRMNDLATTDMAAAILADAETLEAHSKGSISLGPNEEWCVGGHEKLALDMGISVWGIIDKYSRMELCLHAVPNARHPDVPLTLYLQTIQKHGGIPLSTTSDKVGDLESFIDMQSTLRQHFLPSLDIESVPPHNWVNNLTRRRAWRLIWEQHLANVLHFFEKDKIHIGFDPDDPLHESVRLWVWGQAVQCELDNIIALSRCHRIRKQKGTSLPSGGRTSDFFEQPEQWGGVNQLIKIPASELDNLLEEYGNPSILQFGAPDVVSTLEMLWDTVGKPAITPPNAWAIWRLIVDNAASKSTQESHE